MGTRRRANGRGGSDTTAVALSAGAPATPPRPPLHVEVFDHVRTDNQTTSYEATVDLPPAGWALVTDP